MKHQEIINSGLLVIQVILVIVAIILMTGFAMMPTDSSMMTNALLTIMILSQLFTVNILINIYNKLGGKKK